MHYVKTTLSLFMGACLFGMLTVYGWCESGMHALLRRTKRPYLYRFREAELAYLAAGTDGEAILELGELPQAVGEERLYQLPPEWTGRHLRLRARLIAPAQEALELDYVLKGKDAASQQEHFYFFRRPFSAEEDIAGYDSVVFRYPVPANGVLVVVLEDVQCAEEGVTFRVLLEIM